MKNYLKVTNLLILSLCMATIHTSVAQSSLINNDSLYYDQWVGQWHAEVEGVVATEPAFIVKRALYHSAFEEEWLMHESEEKAWRAWDSRTKQWDFAWMSADGLFQLWEGKKVNGIWYMYKTFIIEGKEVLSRQAFIPSGKKVLFRTSEHSRDHGKTWTLRFREKYVKQD